MKCSQCGGKCDCDCDQSITLDLGDSFFAAHHPDPTPPQQATVPHDNLSSDVHPTGTQLQLEYLQQQHHELLRLVYTLKDQSYHNVFNHDSKNPQPETIRFTHDEAVSYLNSLAIGRYHAASNVVDLIQAIEAYGAMKYAEAEFNSGIENKLKHLLDNCKLRLHHQSLGEERAFTKRNSASAALCAVMLKLELLLQLTL